MLASKADQERVFAEVRAEQALRQDQFRVELDASRTSNEELRRVNEELQRDLQRLGERAAGEQSPPIPIRAHLMPFSQVIINVVIPKNFMTPRITFTGTEDPKAHITAFPTRMMFSEGLDVMHCRLFMGTFAGTTVDWFIGLPDRQITSFDQFSTLFMEQFIVNRAPPSVSFDLFRVKQY